MFRPNQTKYKKMHKGRLNKTFSNRNTALRKEKVGIITLQSGMLSPRHLNMVLRSWKNHVKKSGSITFNAHPAHSYTKKSLGTRMGKGKGSVQDYYCRLRPAQLICEFQTTLSTSSILAWAKKTKRKIPLPTAVIYHVNNKKIQLLK